MGTLSILPIFLIYFIFYWLESVKLGNLLRIRVRRWREYICQFRDKAQVQG